MIATIPSAVLVGVDGTCVSVEVHVSNGLPGFTVVGLPDAAVRESRDRVRAALLSSGLTWPLRRVTVNLAPSGVRKGGAGLDLPIAIGLLVAVGRARSTSRRRPGLRRRAGSRRLATGITGMVVLAEALRRHTLVVPEANANEARLPDHGDVRAAGLSSARSSNAWPVVGRGHVGARLDRRPTTPGPDRVQARTIGVIWPT